MSALALKADMLGGERRTIQLPESKTGQKALPLTDVAIEMLDGIPRVEGNPYMIVGNKPGAHLVNLQKPWRRISARAGLGDVRLYDLRHSFASVAAASGFSLPMIGALLGHTQPATTQRYAHLAHNPLRLAGEDISQAILRTLTGSSAPS